MNDAIESRGKLSIDIERFLDYLAVLVFIIFSGSLYFYIQRVRLTMVIVGVVMLLYMLYGRSFTKKNITLVFIYCFLALINTLFTYYNGVDINDFILLIFRCVFLALLQSNMSEKTYKKIFVNIMVVESVISLVCFLYSDVFSLGNLPLQTFEQGSVNGYYLTPYYTLGWSNVGYFGRNAGMFLEPGVHQIFLNFAILFLLTGGEKLGFSKKKYWTSLVILIVTLLTTQSTTGYLCFLVIMCATMFMNKERQDTETGVLGRIRIFALAALIILLVVESTTGVIEDKFAGLETGQSSAKTRYRDTTVGYTLALSHPIFGYGLFNTTISSVLQSYGISSISNGLALFLIGSGLILGVCFLIWTYRGMKRSMPYGIIFNILIFVFYLMCVNSEGGVIAILMYMTFLFEWQPDEEIEIPTSSFS